MIHIFHSCNFNNEISQKFIYYAFIKDIIYGKQKFTEFEFYTEWKIPKGGNSGIFYHIKEGYSSPSEISPEYQLIDDINYASIHDLKSYNEQFGASEPEKLQDWQQTGANYAMHVVQNKNCLLYTSPSPRDATLSRMPSSA